MFLFKKSKQLNGEHKIKGVNLSSEKYPDRLFFFEKIEKFDGSFFYEVRIRWEDGEAYTDIKNSKDELALLLEELNKIVDKITEIKRQK